MKKTPSPAAVGSTLGIALGGLFTYFGYADATAAGTWAGATANLGIGLVAIVFGALAGGWIGGRAHHQYELGERRGAWITAVVALALAAFAGDRIVTAHQAFARLHDIRVETLTPERVSEILSGTIEERAALAFNRSCPPDILILLARDPERDVRETAAGNPGTPLESLDQLLGDADEGVRRAADVNRSSRSKS
jgi:hypothetical protein